MIPDARVPGALHTVWRGKRSLVVDSHFRRRLMMWLVPLRLWVRFSCPLTEARDFPRLYRSLLDRTGDTQGDELPWRQ